jgi:signal recognition particle GTPase
MAEYRFEQSLDTDRKYNSDFQDHLTKTLTSELTKSASRVMETTVRDEVQNTILPALETLTRDEVRAALGLQVAKGVSESINKSLPAELEKLLLRPDVSSHMSRTFTAAVTPLIEKNVRDQIQKTLIPAYHQQASNMIDQLYTDIGEEVVGLKKDIIAYQSETLKNHEVRTRFRSI